VREFVAWVGTQAPHVDALINCAGGFGAIGVLEATDSDEWWQTLRANLFGVYAMTKHVLPLMNGAADPRILNFSGGGAFNAFPHYSAYACSKAAVVRLTECLAEELQPRGIAVNAIAPGFVATEIHAATLAAGEALAGTAHYEATQKTLRDGGARLETVVECIRFLLGPQARGLTGKTISANFDPWRSEEFGAHVDDLVQSDVWTMRRINVVNLEDGPLKAALAEALARRTVGVGG
jgi:3-oxoacyl-[acyl-carrier protein] reductase